MASPQPSQTKRIATVLRKVFGMAALRDGQRRVIESVLAGRDTLAVMPTGSGKSLCYQLPAHLLDGATLVVSPLISLMKDQAEKLEEGGIASAAQVNSSLSRGDELAALAAIGRAEKEVIFCTPERMVTPEFLALLKRSGISLVVIDEAHCISQWGHDFRPAYLEIGAALDALGNPQLLALTATATDEVIADIGRQLGRPRMAVINTGIYRPNLHYRVRQVTNPDEQYAAALQLVRDSDGVGIVYAATVKAAEEMHELLRQAGESATIYHGKLRAGRDGLDAECTLVYYHADKRLQQYFLIKHYPSADELKAVYEAAVALGRASFTEAELKPLLEQTPAGQLKICLKMLKDGKLLKRNRKLAYVLSGGSPKAADFQRMAQLYVDKHERDRQGLDQMVAYAQSGCCRWELLLDYFGDCPPDFARCCRCDNCLSPPSIQDSPQRIEAAPPAGGCTSTPATPPATTVRPTRPSPAGFR
ncbi:RecQ family ATP-dependent DNA helicase [Duganella sp. HSC-15S17]|uniref:DNA 3'-5' helicase n=1 Tax=Duganella violaceipulchra TaxID=2849652 RepID=A0AA41L0X2_9BURK|nr:RecQ family ATP-dependent DNA helicase [Duganella violaceicalia]MCP2007412.1 ATP-dependent DNA helicase RecQ [Duganella violaceicalia]